MSLLQDLPKFLFLKEEEKLSSFWKVFVSFLLFVLPLIYFVFSLEFDPEFRRKDATGFNHGAGKYFVLFYAEKGLFPLRSAADTADLKWTPTLADSLVSCCGSSLLMEKDHWARFGDPGRIWMYMPKVFFTGKAADPSIKPANLIFFILTLQVLWWSFVFCGQWRIGLFFCLLVISSPFYLYEIFNNENIFALVSLTGVFLLGIHLILVLKNFRWTFLWIPLISGLLIAFVNSIRTEVMACLISCLMVYFFSPGISILKRMALTGVFLFTFFLSAKSIDHYFARKYEETTRFVQQHGGIPFAGGRTLRHPAWHPVYCGLGDFDTKYGYHLHDTAVYHYVLPILRKQLNEPLIYPGKTKYSMGEYYDSSHHYYKKPETIPGFDKVCKEKVIHDISNDPLWYAEIILKRIVYFFTQSSPVAIRFYKLNLNIPFTGWIFFPLALCFVYYKKWKEFLLLIFLLPSSASTILMFADGQNSFMSAYPLLMAALLLSALLNYYRQKKSARPLSAGG